MKRCVALLFLASPALAGGPPATPAGQAQVHDFATLTPARARQLAGKRALFRVLPEQARSADGNGGLALYDCKGADDLPRTAWLDLDPGENAGAPLVVEATLHVIRHPAASASINGTGGKAFTEFRLSP